MIAAPRIFVAGPSLPVGVAPIDHRRRLDAGVAASRPREDDRAWSVLTLFVALAGGGFAAFVCTSGASPWVAAFVVMMVLATVSILNPRSGIFLAMIFLPVLGDVRRIVSIGMDQGSDPLVLVGPVLVILLVAMAMWQDRLTRRTPLSKPVFILSVIMVLQVLNPMQGNLMVGLTGVLLVLIPVTWFWIGQSWGSQRFAETILFRVVVPVALAAAVFGLVQVFVGKPRYQEVWMRWFFRGRSIEGGGDAARPFAFFIGVSEFAKYLSVGVVVLLGSLIGGRFRAALLALPVLAAAMFLASVRGPIVLCCASAVLLWAMRSQSKSGWVLRVIIASLCVVGALMWALNEVQEMPVSADVGVLIKHQTEGLLNPLDERKSTATGHAGAVLEGLMSSVHYPLGRGLGVATHVVQLYGARLVGATTEMDISNMFGALGLVGGIAYLLVYYRVAVTAVTYWRRSKSALALSLSAVPLVLACNWINTGEYSTISLVWFCIGAMDRICWCELDDQARMAGEVRRA